MSLLQRGWTALALRFLQGRRRRTFLTGLGVALGAALLSAILILGATMQEAMLRKMQQEYGTWDLMVAVASFETDWVAPEAVHYVQGLDGVAYAVPLITRLSGSVHTPVQFYVGLGHFPDQAVGGLRQLPGPGEVLLPTRIAEQLGLSLGDELTLPFPDGERSLRLAGLLSETEGGAEPTAFFAYEWLAEASGLEGPHALLVGLEPHLRKEKAVALIQAQYPDLHFDLRASLAELRWKLEGLGLVGRLVGAGTLLAGAILTLSAFGISLQERARELAMLRAIGAGQRQVRILLLLEAFWLGALGATSGIVVGIAGAALTMGGVGRYLGAPAAQLVITWPGLAVVWLLAALLTLCGAWPAAVQAGRTRPLAAMRPLPSAEEGRFRRKGGWWGLVLLVGSCLVAGASFLPGVEIPVGAMMGMLGAVLLLVAVHVSLPVIVPWVGECLTFLSARFLPAMLEMGMRNQRRHGHRAARTAGILVVGIALLTAIVGLMLTEASDTMTNMRLRFQTEGWITGPWAPPTGYGQDLVQQIAAVPDVTHIVPIGRVIEVDLVDYDPSRADPQYRQARERNRASVGRQAIQTVDFSALTQVAHMGRVEGDLSGGFVLTRKRAEYLGLQRGEILRVKSPNGEAEWSLPLSALVDELPLTHFMAAAPDLLPDLYPLGEEYGASLVKVNPAGDRQAVAQAVRALLAAQFAAFSYTDFQEMEQNWENQLREQLVMIAGGGLILLLIAGAGLANMMAASVQERRRELATLRSLGTTPRQVAGLLLAEASVVGIAGSLLGATAGVLMLLFSLGRGIVEGGLVLELPSVVLVIGLLAGPLVAVLATLPLVRRVVRDPLTVGMGAQ